MKNLIADRIIERGRARNSDAARGLPSAGLRMSPNRAAELAIGDMSRLPAAETKLTLQAADGQLVFLEGYSVVGGTDVVG